MAKYLYNGLELPELPEWDTTAYPYAYIYYVGETPAFCTLVLVPAAAEIVYEEGTSAILFSTTHYRSYYARSVDEQWDDNGITETSGSIYLLKPWLDYPDNYTVLQWANFNVYNKDNELMFPKSDPIPIDGPVPDEEKFDLNRWLTGFALGLARKPLKLNDNPVVPEVRMAHVYNGIPLPPLQWDKKIFPYALIQYYQSSNMFRCCVYKKINYYQTASMFGLTETYFGQQETGGAMMFDYTLGESGWVKHQSEPIGVRVDRGTTAANVVWSNFDLMYSDGTLFVGASEPEPITDPEPFEGRYYYNTLVCPNPFEDKYDSHYKDFIVKIGNKYVAFLVFNYLGGGYFGVYSGGLYLYAPDTYAGVYVLDDSGEWQRGELEDYLGEETYGYNGNTYYRICAKGDIVWSEEDMTNIGSSTIAFYGSEPVLVDLTILEPPSDPEPPSSVGTDNESMLLTKGWLVGRAIASQRKKQTQDPADVPIGVLISSDGYILRDCNGVYLIAKEDA